MAVNAEGSAGLGFQILKFLDPDIIIPSLIVSLTYPGWEFRMQSSKSSTLIIHSVSCISAFFSLQLLEKGISLYVAKEAHWLSHVALNW